MSLWRVLGQLCLLPIAFISTKLSNGCKHEFPSRSSDYCFHLIFDIVIWFPWISLLWCLFNKLGFLSYTDPRTSHCNFEYNSFIPIKYHYLSTSLSTVTHLSHPSTFQNNREVDTAIREKLLQGPNSITTAFFNSYQYDTNVSIVLQWKKWDMCNTANDIFNV